MNAARSLTSTQSAVLDFIRGAAALVVLFGHVWALVEGDFAFGKKHPWQSLAVAVFFWLSGFLIAYQCLTKERYGFGEYMVDRFCRIYVPLVPALLLSALLLGPLLQRPTPGAPELVANLLMLHHTPFDRIWEALPRFRPYFQNAVLWTIAVEWWLYVLFGVLFFAARARAGARTAMALLAIPALLVVGYFTIKEYVAIVWFAGAVSAYAFVRTGTVSRGAVAAFGFASLAAFAMRLHVLNVASPVNMYDLQLTLALSAALLFLLLSCEGREAGPPPAFQRASAAIAFLSYSLYLTHEPVRVFITARQGWTWNALTPSQATAIAAASLVVGTVFALLFENRHLAVRRAIKRAWKLDTPPPESRP
jgi:peptidoglycan/LPS O-acetylase OafA/YrhL